MRWRPSGKLKEFAGPAAAPAGRFIIRRRLGGLQHRPENRNRFSESTMRRFNRLERPLCIRMDARRSRQAAGAPQGETPAGCPEGNDRAGPDPASAEKMFDHQVKFL